MKLEFDMTQQDIGKEQVVAYMRYSSNNQDEQSIFYQRSAIMTYSFNKGYFISAEYIDEARSGTNDRREGLQQLLADAQNKPAWHKILVYDMSRFSRNNADAIKYTNMLQDLDIEIISVTQCFDNSNEGALLRGIVNLLNEYYSKNLAKHTHAGLKLKAKEAKHCGGKPPLGYDLDNDKHLVLNQEEAEAVKLIFELFEANYSYVRMAEELNNRGYKTKKGTPFNKNSFFSILSQEKYTGTYTWNKVRQKNSKGQRNSHKEKPIEEQVIIKDTIPVIISPEQFKRVQQRIAERSGGKSSSKSRHYYLLSGMDKLKCAKCGANLVGTTRASHGIPYTYYYCPNHKNKTCETKEIRADYLDKFVVSAVVRDIKYRKDLINIFNHTDSKDRIKTLKNKINGLETSSKNILKTLRTSSTPELLEELNTIKQEKDNLQLELDNLMQPQEMLLEEDRTDLCKKIGKILLKSETYEGKKYLSAVIDKIVVSNDDIELTLNIS